MTTKHTTGTWTLARTMSRIEVRVSPVKAYAFSHSDEANARLIAAAPDLLAALEDATALLDAIAKGYPDIAMDTRVTKARIRHRAAIAKAQGQE